MLNPKYINWEEKKDELISYMKQGLSFKEIGKFYGLKSRTMSSVVIRLRIRNYYTYKQEPWKKYILTDEDKMGLSEEVIKRLGTYKNIKYRYTRNFLASELTKNINSKFPKGLIVKEDIIEQYHETRKISGTREFNYDFSRLPDYVNDTHEKFTIFVNEVSPKSHKLVGEWKTCFKDFIITGNEHSVCSGILTKEIFAYSTEEFVEMCKEMFGDTYGYDKVEYVNLTTPIILKCNKCGRYFSQRPNELIYGKGFGCPACTMRDVGDRKFLDKEEFIRRCIDIYGDIYDFSGTNYRGLRREIIAFNKTTEEYITGTPEEFLRGNIETPRKSKGEKKVSKWLTENNIKFQDEVTMKNEIFARKTKTIRVDFVIENYLGKTYWIEYNGFQHYNYQDNDSGFFDKDRFISQCLRDDSEKKYCSLNNIELIEIPYTYKTFSDIGNVLKQILIDGKSTEIIDIPKRMSYE